MSYEGGKLRPWFDTTPNRRAAKRMAEKGGDQMLKRTEHHTPVDTAHLRQSWRRKPVLIIANERGERVYQSGVETDVDYAPYVEYGTGLWGPKHAKYEIKPKHPDGWLHWIDPHTGDSVFAKRVMHPGSPGAHMVAIAVAETEAGLDALLAPILREWAREVERQNHTGLRGRAA